MSDGLTRAQVQLVAEWVMARNAGIHAGSSCRVMVELRARLLAAGLWWVPYSRTIPSLDPHRRGASQEPL